MEAEDGLKTRSFRYEDYNTRRMFLRSYPLQWELEDERVEVEGDQRQSEEVVLSSSSSNNSKASLKTRLVAVFNWGEGKLLLLRRLKGKVAFYLVTCHPLGFKSSSNRLTA